MNKKYSSKIVKKKNYCDNKWISRWKEKKNYTKRKNNEKYNNFVLSIIVKEEKEK